MPEKGELSSRLNEYIKGLKRQAEGLHTSAEGYALQAKYLAAQVALFERYPKVPIAMQTAQFIIEQIAATTSSSSASENPSEESVVSGIIVRVRTRSASRRREENQPKNYNIAPQVKSIMNGIFGRGIEAVPEDLDSLFNGIYGQDWRTRTISVPSGLGLGRMNRTYLEDLNSENSYIRGLIEGADRVINSNMRDNTAPAFLFRGRVAAVNLVQLYYNIEAIGWDVYDDFMIRNRIRQPIPNAS